MEAMVNAILENARLHHDHANLEKKPSDLDQFVKEIPRVDESRSPGVIFSDPVPVIFGFDRARIKTVVVNILENAIKYSTPQSEPVTINLECRPSWGIVTIQGMGIEKNKLTHILEPFYRLDNSRSKKTGGCGLGLSLCKAIMNAHGRKI